MSSSIVLTHGDVITLTARLAITLQTLYAERGAPLRVYPIPRGGIPVAYLLGALTQARVTIANTPEEAEVFVDDLIGSGATCERYCEAYPEVPFLTLLDKRTDDHYKGKWIVFPWEQTEEVGVEDHIIRLLEFTGDDPTRGGLIETPARVAKAWSHWCSGYGKDPAAILKVFEDGAERYDQMVTVKDIPIYSFCEHHMSPIFGTATISYIPNGKIVGLSKLSRLADMYARRLQVQERLTDQIADALYKHLDAAGVGVVIKARHMCMESRGICQQGHHTITTSLRGAMKDEPAARSEFLEVAR